MIELFHSLFFNSNFMVTEMVKIEGEVFGIFSLIFLVLSFLEKDEKKTFLLLAIGSVFYAVHFWFLGLITAAFINIIDIVKNSTLYKLKKNDYIFGFFLILYITIGIQTSQIGVIKDNSTMIYLNYMFTFATVITMFATFYLKGLSLGICYLIGILLQLVFTITCGSILGSIMNILFLFNILNSVFGLYKKESLRRKLRYYRISTIKKVRNLLGMKPKRYRIM